MNKIRLTILGAAAISLAGIGSANAIIASKEYVDVVGTAAATAQAAAEGAQTDATSALDKIGTAPLSTTAQTITAAINEVAQNVGAIELDAAAIEYSNAGSGLTAGTAQAAIDELASGKANTADLGSAAFVETTAFDAAGTAAGLVNALGGLATKSAVTSADITDGTITTSDISATAGIEKTQLAEGVQDSLDKADTALQAAALTGLEQTANKSDSILTDTGSTTKYTTVNAVETYAVPKPQAACTSAGTQCVLAVNKADGTIFWDEVTAVP